MISSLGGAGALCPDSSEPQVRVGRGIARNFWDAGAAVLKELGIEGLQPGGKAYSVIGAAAVLAAAVFIRRTNHQLPELTLELALRRCGNPDSSASGTHVPAPPAGPLMSARMPGQRGRGSTGGCGSGSVVEGVEAQRGAVQPTEGCRPSAPVGPRDAGRISTGQGLMHDGSRVPSPSLRYIDSEDEGTASAMDGSDAHACVTSNMSPPVPGHHPAALVNHCGRNTTSLPPLHPALGVDPSGGGEVVHACGVLPHNSSKISQWHPATGGAAHAGPVHSDHMQQRWSLKEYPQPLLHGSAACMCVGPRASGGQPTSVGRRCAKRGTRSCAVAAEVAAVAPALKRTHLAIPRPHTFACVPCISGACSPLREPSMEQCVNPFETVRGGPPNAHGATEPHVRCRDSSHA